MKVAFFDTKSYDREFFTNDALEFQFYDCRLSKDTCTLAKGSDAVCLFVNDTADRDCLEKLAGLGIKHIALRCAGFNNVDLSAAEEFGIQVTRVPEYSPHAVAEHTIALLLTLNRQIHRAYNRVRDHNFSLAGLVGFDLHGKTAGIIGAGKIGRITAEILKCFGCQVLIYDLKLDQAWASGKGMTENDFENLLENSDIISLHLPLTPETHHLIDEAALQRMKPGSYLINTGRGKLIETTALLAALKAGHLGGVALDVYEEEEGVFFEDLSNTILQDDELSRLLTFPNVLITSHQAFLTKEALTQISETTCENILRGQKGSSFLDGSLLTQSQHS